MTKVFVHGNPETTAIWDLLVPALGQRGVDDIELLTPPGFGSPRPSWDPTPANYVSWLGGELERIGGTIDLVGHDWGAGHVYGTVAERPDLMRSWAADCAGLLHPDYVWHDMAQVWQTPEAGEEAIAGMVAAPVADRSAMFESLGLTPDMAASLADAACDDMGQCILTLYRGAAQPALSELGDRLAAGRRVPGLVIDATADPYVGTDLAGWAVDNLGADRLVLDGKGHWWMADPDGVEAAADGLARFWAGLPG